MSKKLKTQRCGPSSTQHHTGLPKGVPEQVSHFSGAWGWGVQSFPPPPPDVVGRGWGPVIQGNSSRPFLDVSLDVDTARKGKAKRSQGDKVRLSWLPRVHRVDR